MKKLFAVFLSAIMLVPALAFAKPTLLNLHANEHASSTISTLATIAVSGTAAAVSAPNITLTGSNGTTYSVDGTNAKVLRKFGATMQISDIQVGDSLQVQGTVSGTSITAKNIRDNSQQQRNATFSGTVTAVNSPSFTLATKNRANQTINTTGSTVFKKGGQADSNGISDVTVGENVTVSGVWDSTANTVAAANVNIVVKTGTINGTLTSVSNTTLMVTAKNSSSTVYTVDASSAKLIRRFGATMQFGDYQIGDMLAVSGVINGMNITAKTVRDNSLQAHNGTFTGTITAVNSPSFTLQSKDRGTQTINTTGTTTYRLGTASSSFSSLAVGQTITVSGVWDRTQNNVTANKVSIKVSSITITGTLNSISSNMLTVTTASSTVYSVDATKAKVEFEHGHKGSLTNFQVNDQVKVWGKEVSGSTSLTASIVQDLSRTYNATTTP